MQTQYSLILKGLYEVHVFLCFSLIFRFSWCFNCCRISCLYSSQKSWKTT